MGWFSALLERRSPRTWTLLAVITAIATATVLLITVQAAFANHPEASLAGSNFEIDVDANLKVDDPAPPSLDWANVNEVRVTDKVNGTGDNSYSGGVKEDTVCPSETTDSIPPNKSDLLSFHTYTEAATAGNKGFLNLAWSRVSEPSGTTLMDFELNQSNTKCANGPNNVRTAGDLLLEYAIDQGGSRADITVRRWTGTAWGPTTDLDVNNPICGGNPCASGTINSSTIPAADSDGLITTGSKQARTFGEAQLDLRYIFQTDKCASFGSAMLKSRSSDSFTSQLKDFVAPANINLQNCGQVIIRKQTTPDENPNTTDFGYTKAFSTDPSTTNTFTLKDDGVKDYGKTVLFGSGYTVTEDVIPTNWAFDNVTCSASTGVTPSINGATVTFDIDAATDILDCTYTNSLQLGALKILKNSTKGGAVAQPGAVFSYDGSSVTDNGANDEDSDVGEVCVSGLTTGDYTVNETSPPPGYGDAPASEVDQSVTVVTGTNCTDNQPGEGATATFTNPPLADLQVNFRDGGSGETSVTSMTCDNTGTTPSTTPATGWDDSVTHEGISIDPSPRTVTCTIVIDP
jgi:hypothetical protein